MATQAVAKKSIPKPRSRKPPATGKRRRGRPSILEQDLSHTIIKEIEQALLGGNFLTTAVAAAGVSRKAVYDWMRKGARDERKGEFTIERELLYAIKKGRARGERRLVNLISTAAADGKWQAAARILESSYPQRWLRRYGVDVNQLGKGEGQEEILRAVLQAVTVARGNPKLSEDEIIMQVLDGVMAPEDGGFDSAGATVDQEAQEAGYAMAGVQPPKQLPGAPVPAGGQKPLVIDVVEAQRTDKAKAVLARAAGKGNGAK